MTALLPAPALLLALEAILVAGGGSAPANYDSHRLHVEALTAELLERGVSRDRITIFFADGPDPGPDRAVGGAPDVDGGWMLEGPKMLSRTRPRPRLENTAIDGHVLRPATRAALQAHLIDVGARTEPGDTVLIAVTDHGTREPAGRRESRISLWGEHLTESELVEMLAPVGADVRIALWMSQCHSGGFALLHDARANLCGAFAAHPERQSYGCFPDLGSQPAVGHFIRMVDALERHSALGAMTDEVRLTDGTPDTPHLTSDAHLYDRIAHAARDSGRTVAALVDAALPEAPADAPEKALIAAILERFGLPAVAGYGEAIALRGELAVIQEHELGRWRSRWEGLSRTTRIGLTRPHLGYAEALSDEATQDEMMAARAATVNDIRSAWAGRPRVLERTRELVVRERAAKRLDTRLMARIAALERVAWLYLRWSARGPLEGLDAAARSERAALLECEAAPLLPPPESPPPLAPPARKTTLAAVLGEVDALRPAWFGIGHERRPDDAGRMGVKKVQPESPAAIAGLRAGDLLVSVGGQRLDPPAALPSSAALLRHGEPVSIVLDRPDGGGAADATRMTVTMVPTRMRDARPRAPVGSRVERQRFVAHGGDPIEWFAADEPGVVFFWATWCGPCKKLLPHLETWSQKTGARVVAVTEEDADTVASFLADFGRFPFPIARDEDRRLHARFGVSAYPTMVRMGADGVVAGRQRGFDGSPLLVDWGADAAPEAPPLRALAARRPWSQRPPSVAEVAQALEVRRATPGRLRLHAGVMGARASDGTAIGTELDASWWGRWWRAGLRFDFATVGADEGDETPLLLDGRLNAAIAVIGTPRTRWELGASGGWRDFDGEGAPVMGTDLVARGFPAERFGLDGRAGVAWLLGEAHGSAGSPALGDDEAMWTVGIDGVLRRRDAAELRLGVAYVEDLGARWVLVRFAGVLDLTGGGAR
jgi:thiol-disulfide isomerase/thioredoxin